jgi:hypothetical protein
VLATIPPPLQAPTTTPLSAKLAAPVKTPATVPVQAPAAPKVPGLPHPLNYYYRGIE